jgi:hypothetical protein
MRLPAPPSEVNKRQMLTNRRIFVEDYVDQNINEHKTYKEMLVLLVSQNSLSRFYINIQTMTLRCDRAWN